MTEPYTPPDGNKLAFNFEGPHTAAPAGNLLAFNFTHSGNTGPAEDQHILPLGWGSDAYGPPSVRLALVRVGAIGMASAALGTPSVRLNTRYIGLAGRGIAGAMYGRPTVRTTPSLHPPGFVATAMGAPWVSHYHREVRAGLGTPSTALGNPGIFNLDQYVGVAGLAAGRYGTQQVTHGVRRLILQGFTKAAVPAPRVEFKTRLLYPSWKHTERVGFPMAGGLRFIAAQGFEATRWGTRIIPEAQTIGGQGFVASFWGDAKPWNYVQLAKPAGFLSLGEQPADRWGWADAFNSRQYIAHVHDVDSEMAPLPWSRWTRIENRNRVLGVQGIDSARFGYLQIDNNARVMEHVSIEPAPPRAYLVAYRIRPLRLDGIEAPYISNWVNVRNAAKVLSPKGLVATIFGNASQENTRREFNRIGGWEAADIGTPMVADRIRTIAANSRYGIAPPTVALPDVRLHTRYVEPPGWEPALFGRHYLIHHRNILAPRWVLQQKWGTPSVRNVTPHLWTKGANSEEFGQPNLRLQWRPLQPYGSTLTLFGRTSIGDLHRKVLGHGFPSSRFSDKHKVQLGGTPPYVEQRIGVGGIPPIYPLSPDQEKYHLHHLNMLGVIHKQEGDSTLWGLPRLTSNVIRTPIGFHEYDPVGKHTVSAWIRTIAVDTSDDFDASKGLRPPFAGMPRLSPHTIYAGVEAPEQARKNHPFTGQLGPHIIDGKRIGGADVQWGKVLVALRTQVIRPQGTRWVQDTNDKSFPHPYPTVRNARAVVTPEGMRSLRMGYPLMPGLLEVEQFDSYAGPGWGKPAVTRPPYVGPQSVAPSSFVASAWGASRVEPLHRPIFPVGSDMALLGTKVNNDKPYMWKGLRVGPLMPTITEGADTSVFGQTWVSLRVREVLVAGFDELDTNYDLANWKDGRMRVWRRNHDAAPVAQRITADGFVATQCGTPGLRNRAHYIRPDGNAEQYRKGAP